MICAWHYLSLTDIDLMNQVIVPLKRNVTSLLVAVAVVAEVVIVVYSQELEYENVTTVLEITSGN